MAQQGDDTITAIAEVHDQQVSTRSGRVLSNRSESDTTPPAPKNKKPSQTKPKPGNQGKSSTSNRMTIASLSLIVDNIQQQNNERVGRLENRVDEVHDKMDRMLALMTKNASNEVSGDTQRTGQATECTQLRPAPQAGHTVQADTSVQEHPRPAPANSTPVQAARPVPVMPPPQVIIREENQDGALDKLLAKEDYRNSTTHGKAVSPDQAMVKPYMYIDREGLQTPKQRLEVRATMTFHEYMNCTLLLLNDEEAYDKSDLQHILFHLSAVATDAMFRPWPGVRRWTQAIWDYIERGKCQWDSYVFIQNERVRMSYMSGSQTNNQLPHANGSRTAAQEPAVVVVCRDYNAPGGCRFQSNHEDKGVKHLHICSHCDTLGRKSNHSYQRCRSKNNFQQHASGNQGHAGQYDQRQWAPPPQAYNNQQQYGQQYQGVVQGRGPQYQAPPPSKNS